MLQKRHWEMPCLARTFLTSEPWWFIWTGARRETDAFEDCHSRRADVCSGRRCGVSYDETGGVEELRMVRYISQRQRETAISPPNSNAAKTSAESAVCAA
jgi:hypothetical protein